MSNSAKIYKIESSINKRDSKSLEDEIQRLKIQLDYERKLRIEAEKKIIELENQLVSEKRHEKVKKISHKELEEKSEEILALRKQENMSVAQISEKLGIPSQTISRELAYLDPCDVKINGVKKATPAESIRSYDDFVAIQNYLLNKTYRGKPNLNIRNYMFWTIGVAFGVRVSDLVKLKFKNVLNADGTFRKKTSIVEKKTRKIQNLLVTEAVVKAVTMYLDSIDWKFSIDDYLFPFGTTQGYKILDEAQKELNITFNIGSHTMRKSFANIAACVDNSKIDMNTITKVQGLLNQGNQQTTMLYLETLDNMYDCARKSVSDFILGKTEINELVCGTKDTTEESMMILEKILVILQNKSTDQLP